MAQLNPETFTTFERAVMEKHLAGDHPVLAALRCQLPNCAVSRRDFTGHGFFAHLDVGAGALPVAKCRPRLVLSDVGATVPELRLGAGFALFIHDGLLSVLEGFTYGETWPAEVTRFSLFYTSGSERRVDRLELE